MNKKKTKKLTAKDARKIVEDLVIAPWGRFQKMTKKEQKEYEKRQKIRELEREEERRLDEIRRNKRIVDMTVGELEDLIEEKVRRYE